MSPEGLRAAGTQAWELGGCVGQGCVAALNWVCAFLPVSQSLAGIEGTSFLSIPGAGSGVRTRNLGDLHSPHLNPEVQPRLAQAGFGSYIFN